MWTLSRYRRLFRPRATGSPSAPDDPSPTPLEVAPEPHSDGLTGVGDDAGSAHPAVEPAHDYAPIALGTPGPVFEPLVSRTDVFPALFRPDTVIDGWQTAWFSLRGATVRGYEHRYDGTPRQDDFCAVLRAGDREVILCAGDGVSGARFSHVGATTVVRYATRWLDSRLDEGWLDVDWPALIRDTAWAVVEQARTLSGDPEMDAEQAEQLMATTLVCAVVRHEGADGIRVELLSIGDSVAWRLSPTGFQQLVGGKPRPDEIVASSAVTGLPRVPDVPATASVRLLEGDVLLLGTDGIDDPLGSGRGSVGRHLTSLVLDRVPTLLEFAHGIDFSRETFDDDRTLIALWPRSGEV